MDLIHLLSHSTIAENLYSHLSFESAIDLFIASRSKCIPYPIRIDDRDHQISFLNRVDSETINTYNYIKLYGSRGSLVLAAQQNQLQIVKVLGEHGVNIDGTDRRGYTALMEAAQNGWKEMIQLLLDFSANPNVGGDWRNTALMWASNNGHLEIVELLIQNFAEVDLTTQFGYTALMYAVRGGHFEIVKKLLENGAKSRRTNIHGNSALTLAITSHQMNIVQLISDFEDF